MLADVMPNILALAPYESVFGLVCSCRTLSRAPIERAKYEVEEPVLLDELTGEMTRYPNGWRLRMRVAGDLIHPFVTHIAYAHGIPWAIFATGGDITPVLSLETGIRCDIIGKSVRVSGACLPHISVTADHIDHDELVDGWIAEQIAAVLRPVLPITVAAIGDVVATLIDATDVFARHIGNSRAPNILCSDSILDMIMRDRSQWN